MPVSYSSDLGETWQWGISEFPVVSNTQGGPIHDENQRVLDARGDPISGLYEAGELGSFFGHVYLLGGNITEGIAGGRLAGQLAAARARACVRIASTYAGLSGAPGP